MICSRTFHFPVLSKTVMRCIVSPPLLAGTIDAMLKGKRRLRLHLRLRLHPEALWAGGSSTVSQYSNWQNDTEVSFVLQPMSLGLVHLHVHLQCQNESKQKSLVNLISHLFLRQHQVTM